jgi:hypothetical protein
MKIITLVSVLLGASLLATGAFAGGTGTLMPEAHAAMKDTATVNVDNKWNYIRFRPRGGVATQNACFVFYPGGLVAPEAYAPYGQALAAEGYLSYILRVPVGLSLLEPGAANDVKWFDYFAIRYCDHYVISGHSLGGVTASTYVSTQPDDALVLLASYTQEFVSIDDPSPVTSLYGSNDCQTTAADIDASVDNLPDSTRFIEIAGGNHQQFAWYEEDVAPECEASIDRSYQFGIAVEEILEMLATRQ